MAGKQPINAGRSTKFYRENEREVMEALGLKATKNSGAGWVEKEDGQNDYLICQLKSTDARSISVKQSDIRTLEKNATIAHKIPIFAIQFLNTGEVWLMAKPVDFSNVAEFIQTGSVEQKIIPDEVTDYEELEKPDIPVVHSSEDARKAFHEQREAKFKKEKKSW